MIAVLALAAQAVPSAFSPPLDRAIEVISQTERTDHGVTRRFVGGRRILFRKTDGGYRAEVTIDQGQADGEADDPAAMFNAGMAKLAGMTVLFDLDPDGKVVAVENQAEAWQRMLDGIAALAPPGGGDGDRRRAGRIRAVIAALSALPAERQRATLASLIAPLVAIDIATRGERPAEAIRVPGQSAFGMVQLDGIRTVRRRGAMLESDVSAAGEVSLRGPDGQVAGHMTTETRRLADPATGLVMEYHELVRTLAADGAVVTQRRTTTRVTP